MNAKDCSGMFNKEKSWVGCCWDDKEEYCLLICILSLKFLGIYLPKICKLQSIDNNDVGNVEPVLNKNYVIWGQKIYIYTGYLKRTYLVLVFPLKIKTER